MFPTQRLDLDSKAFFEDCGGPNTLWGWVWGLQDTDINQTCSFDLADGQRVYNARILEVALPFVFSERGAT